MTNGMVSTRAAEHFGTVLVAMVTPFDKDMKLDVDAGVKLAAKLVDDGCDGLVLGGTTGESPTTSTAEKLTLIREVKNALGERAKIVAGAGNYSTDSSVDLAQQSVNAGADALLIVTPYYSKPPQEGVYQHFKTVASAVDAPIMLYDIPGRTATPIAEETAMRLAEVPNIVAIKEAKGDLAAGARLYQKTELALYSGDDPINIPWLSVGATGFVSVVGHCAARTLRDMRTAFDRGDLAEALRLNSTMFPLNRAMARSGGVSFAKAALDIMGMSVGSPRLPQVPLSDEARDALLEDLRQAGVVS
ncbi:MULTISPECIES: 4-hydroxy-tetrahydrodipicolinate synthase [Lawsonella]|uniref:4-hydroxy-tetrahydrodipicolinate synthase n=1 Tax=Lawsonella clevelandensis TaxID=1528099 RepID=A0A2W5K4T7_9ACTN|nr:MULTISPECIES: 4-hydroxy-tetrahydrodipicolinate synthase [Lawsonella]PZP89836.1 MAG: 4-hydroxy-tetrahydrodipicolinate synthase [Lawsonella clevelandensis]